MTSGASSFRRSGRFGIIGVFVVAAVAAVIATKMGNGEAKPKDAYALIFGVVGVYIVLLFLFQMRDLSAAEAADAGAQKLAPGDIENPATLDEPTLWAAMAIGPIDAGAVRARRDIWAGTRSSINTAMLVCALIFLAVPPIYLLDTYVPLMVGGPLIGLIALWKSVRLLGGGIDEAYETAGRAMAPLGLRVVEHPEVHIQPVSVAPYGVGPRLHGTLAMEGERYGRRVSIRMPSSAGVRTPSEVRVGAATPPFEFKARDGRLKAGKADPEAVREALKRVPNSTRWNGVSGAGGDGAVVVERKSSHGGDWLLDLWLAERLIEVC